MQEELLAFGVVKRQTGVIVLDYAAQGSGDGAKQFAQIERGDYDIVHLQQQTQMVTFARQLKLTRPGALEIECIVYGDGHQRRNLLQEFQVAFAVGGLPQVPESQSA